RNEGTRLLPAKTSAVIVIRRNEMAAEPWRVPDSLWHELEPLIPKVERRFRYPGRKRHDDRACLEGILYVLRHGLPWRALPRLEGLPSGQTCWRRLDEWERAGVWAALLERLQQRLAEAERIDWSRAIVDASLVDAKRGGRRSRAASAATAAAGADDLARPPPAGEDARPARARALAGRAHERLATQLAPDLDSLGAAGRALPGPAPARLLDDHLSGARLVIVRPVPVPKSVLGPPPFQGQSPFGDSP